MTTNHAASQEELEDTVDGIANRQHLTDCSVLDSPDSECKEISSFLAFKQHSPT